MDDLKRWSEEQANLMGEIAESPEEEKEAASVVTLCDGDTANLKIAELRSGWVSVGELIAWAKTRDYLVLVQDAAISNLAYRERPNLRLLDNVLSTNPGWPGMLNTRRDTYVEWPPITDLDPGRNRGSLRDLVIRSVAKAWEADLSDLIQASSFSTDDVNFAEEVGEENDEKISIDHVDVLRRNA